MLTKRAIITAVAFILVVTISLLGCSKQPTELQATPAHKQPLQHPSQQDETGHNDTPEQSTGTGTNAETNTNKEQKNDAHVSASHEDEQHGDQVAIDGLPLESESSSNTDDNMPHVELPEPEEIAPFNPQKPMLIGLMIGQSKDLIKEKFGMPKEEYVMEDPLDPITVYEYNGFLVGYDKQQLIAFIDINSISINPGLNGLMLGDSIDTAVKALGNPDTRTAFVMNYHTSESILKLDLDPHTQTISSIKLFGASD